ncbi:hypothetical protein [Pseudoxanthomonas sp. LARHCG66]
MRQILAAAVFCASTALAAEPSLVADNELSLGGIALGDTEASVLHRLGKPLRTTDTGDFLSIRMDYPGLTVWLGEERRVGEILSTTAQHCTPIDVCPGMPFARAKTKYGPPLVADREDGTYMEYPSSQSSCWLQIALSTGNIRSIRAECQS